MVRELNHTLVYKQKKENNSNQEASKSTTKAEELQKTTLRSLEDCIIALYTSDGDLKKAKSKLLGLDYWEIKE